MNILFLGEEHEKGHLFIFNLITILPATKRTELETVSKFSSFFLIHHYLNNNKNTSYLFESIYLKSCLLKGLH